MTASKKDRGAGPRIAGAGIDSLACFGLIE